MENTATSLLTKPLDDFLSLDSFDDGYIKARSAILYALSIQSRISFHCFGKGYPLEGKDRERALFSKMYPALSKSLSRFYPTGGLKELTTFLESLRDSLMDRESINSVLPFSFLSSLPNDSNYPYVCKEGPTVAGVLAVLLMMANQDILRMLVTNGFWTGIFDQIGLFLGYRGLRPKAFGEKLMEVTGTTLDLEIRQRPGTGILASIFGEYEDGLKIMGNRFIYANGPWNEASYKVGGELSKAGGVATLTIYKDGFLHCRFDEDYSLRIEDEQSFVSWSNSLPPFLFLAYLKQRGISVYRSETIRDEDAIRLQKMKKARYFVDKTVETILPSNPYSDSRQIGDLLSAAYIKLAQIIIKAGSKATKDLAIQSFFDVYHDLCGGILPFMDRSSGQGITIDELLATYLSAVSSMEKGRNGPISEDCPLLAFSTIRSIVDLRYSKDAGLWWKLLSGDASAMDKLFSKSSDANPSFVNEAFLKAVQSLLGIDGLWYRDIELDLGKDTIVPKANIKLSKGRYNVILPSDKISLGKMLGIDLLETKNLVSIGPIRFEGYRNAD